MNNCYKCYYPVSPGGYKWKLDLNDIHCVCNNCLDIMNIQDNHVYNNDDILFLTGKCGICETTTPCYSQPNYQIETIINDNKKEYYECCRYCYIKPMVISNGTFEVTQGSDTDKEMEIGQQSCSDLNYQLYKENTTRITNFKYAVVVWYNKPFILNTDTKSNDKKLKRLRRASFCPDIK